jgi:hypothetical protein
MVRKRTVRATGSCFRELDDLVLGLKGLVLVREIRTRRHADDDELEMYSAEIRRVRTRLAELVANGGGAETRVA